MRVEISIERLSLHGYPAAAARRIRAALERELAQLILKKGLPRSLSEDAHRRRLQAPAAQLSAGADAPAGRAVARSVYRSLDTLHRPAPHLNTKTTR
jgi:hypothetical protein